MCAAGSSAAQVNWLVADQLGTPRMVVDQTGSLAGVKRHDYLPFGEEIYAGTGARTSAQGYGASDGVRQKFTQKERDAETGLDYFLARYYSPSMGRFTSPDEFKGGPEELFEEVDPHDPLFYADTGAPQSLNKYHYCLNNPLRYVDPDGHQETTSDRLKSAAKETVKTVGDFVLGVGRGIGASVSYGVCQSCNPDEGDSVASRAGQILGTATVGSAGTGSMAAGGGEIVVTGGTAALTGVPEVQILAGAYLATGAAKNGARLAATPMRTNNTSGDRSGKGFTRKGKQEVIKQNAEKNGGVNRCENCGVKTVPAKQSQRGVKPPRNETQVDHIDPKSRGGQGRPPNGQVLCRGCNRAKSDKMPEQK